MSNYMPKPKAVVRAVAIIILAAVAWLAGHCLPGCNIASRDGRITVTIPAPRVLDMDPNARHAEF
jgi:hypothetical protein